MGKTVRERRRGRSRRRRRRETWIKWERRRGPRLVHMGVRMMEFGQRLTQNREIWSMNRD
jgi:hypothetical protein